MTQPVEKICLNYYILGESPVNIFPIEIPRDARIQDVLKIIIEDYKIYGTIMRPALLKTDRAEDDLPERPDLSLDTHLKHHRRVETYWPAGDQIDETRVHVLVEAQELIYQKMCFDSVTRSYVPPPQDTLGEFPGQLRLLQDRQDKTAKRFQNDSTASEAALHTEFLTQQTEDNNPIFNGRPYNRTALPIQLFHPVFDTFTKALEEIDGLRSSQYAAVEELLHEAQMIHLTKQARWTELKSSLMVALSSDIINETTPKCHASGLISFFDIDNALRAYCAVIEIQNEIGTGKSDPSIQVAESYGIYWSQEKRSRFRQICCCPSLVIAIAGPWMCVLGAIYLDHVVVQPLTEYIWLGHHPQQDRRLTRMTQVFNAISISIRELRTYYGSQRDRLIGRPPTLIDDMRFFPHARQYGAGETIVRFEYSGFMGDLRVTRPIFNASTEEGEDIVVKFSERYNIGAHRMLAAEGLAPRVLSYEAPPSSGGYHTIVMEHLHSLSLKEYLSSHPNIKASELETVRSDISRALEILHDDGLVFGDLRAPNILVVEQDDGEPHGMLVDFDWCSQENVGRYPAGLNQNRWIQWAEGVEKGGLMQKRHDLEMFEKLFG